MQKNAEYRIEIGMRDIVGLLKACTQKKDLSKGSQLHVDILKRGLLDTNPYIACSLVSMYAKCGAIETAQEVLADLPVRDVFSWNALISGYVQEGYGVKALASFELMKMEGIPPNEVTFICILKACGCMGSIERGKKIHDEISCKGLLEKSVVLGNALVDMYIKCGMLMKAQQALEDLPSRNVISWSTLIAGYAQEGQAHKAICCFQQMRREGISPNEVTFICILKACGSIQAVGLGKTIHDEISNRGLLEKNVLLGNALVDMYAKCGLLAKARQIIDQLPVQNVVSWSALIAGYSQNGQGQEALDCFERMQRDGISPNEVTFACVLKACASVGSVSTGERIHNEIRNKGLLHTNIVVGNALVDMYAKCGALGKAQEVLEELPVRDTISWSVLIAGFTHNEQYYEALNCFECMTKEGLSPDGVTFTFALMACGKLGAVNQGKAIHEEILTKGLLKKNVVLGTALIDMYARCGLPTKAQKLLEENPVLISNEISWSALISGYVQTGQYLEALNCFDRMQKDGLFIDGVTFVSVLKACGKIRAFEKGRQIHNEIMNRSLLNENLMLGNALVDMYVKFDMLGKAEKVLEELPAQNIGAWNALISGYVQHGHARKAIDCFVKIKEKGICPDAVTFAGVLKACGSVGAIETGKEIHNDIISRKLLQQNVLVGSALIDMYAKCGVLAKAREVLEELSVRDIVSWSALIAGYAQAGRGYEALSCFEQMQKEGISPNDITFICALKACGSIDAIEIGKRIHEEVVDQGLFETNVELGNTLVDMYAKCGVLASAMQVFEQLPVRNASSWNALIAAYTQEERGHEALACFAEMRREGLCPDEITLTCILKACSSIKDVDKGKEIHNEIVNRILLEKNIVLGNALLCMYARCGALEKAKGVLESLPVRNVVSWNVLIAAYAQQEQAFGAINCFLCMQREGLSPDEATFVCMLKACRRLGAIKYAEELHDEILSAGLLDTSAVLGTALVDMYAKCGLLAKAHNVLRVLPNRDTVCWSALISGYSQEGQGHEALKCFVQMQEEGHSPDEVTFLCVLKACCNAGRLDEAQTYYENLTTSYGIVPKLPHFTCMLVAYGCTGQFDKAISMINGMAHPDAPSAWLALLAVCRKLGNVKLGRLAFDKATQHGSSLAVAYVLMSNIYAAAGMDEDAHMVDAMRVKSVQGTDKRV